jgi:hypothetical protein
MVESQTAEAILERPPACRVTRPHTLSTLVVDLAGGLGVEYAETTGAVCLDPESFAEVQDVAGFRQLVLFLPTRRPRINSPLLDRVEALANSVTELRVCVISSFRAHFADTDLLDAERSIIERLCQATSASVIILRPGNVLSHGCRLRSVIKRLAPLYPTVPRGLRSCFLDTHELFAAIDDVMSRKSQPRVRVVTILGPNRPVQEVLAEHVSPGRITQLVVLLAKLLAWLCLGRLIGLAFRLAAHIHRPWRRWQFDTLSPTSTAELLSLFNPYNRQHVAIAGYNTGVVHFGWKWPMRTIVKTIGSGRLVRLQGESVVVDAGVTLKQTVDTLRQVGRQLCVVPNYSYISMGTTFFVPIHGSACEVSTLGETIEKIWLYDARADRLLVLRRNDPRFAEAMYCTSSGWLALRLKLRVQMKRRFVVRCSTLDSPTASEVWRLLAERDAANIELRKTRADASKVDVSKYYPAEAADEAALDVAQDCVGRLWDRLEENSLTSFAFHALVRRWGFHVELFLDEQEFAVFWEAHAGLPLSKIQLRFVRADQLPHSPCGRRDCISTDLFMPRSKSPAFLNFIREHLPHARFNPGKHSV